MVDKARRDLQNKETNLVSRRDGLIKVIDKLDTLNDQLKTLDETKTLLLREKKSELSRVQTELDETHSEAGSLKKEIEIIKKQIETCSDLDRRQDLLEVIVNTFSKDGFPRYVMSQHMDHINGRMNDLLSKVVDFTVDLKIDDEKGNLDVILNKKGRRRVAELGSGMERTLVSLALRVALRDISAIPMPDFFIVDEGFAMLDADNVMACRNLLAELKKIFRFVVVMTHNDVIKEMMDKTIEVSMVGDFSKIDAGNS
jgi:DNA repair exonuclease SbcCD ATPase subunit